MTIHIDPAGLTPEPILPEVMPRPCTVGYVEYPGTPWTWAPEKVELLRTPRSKTLMDQIDQLVIAYDLKLFRPLNAAELHQIVPFCDEWPEKWRRARGGRVFFAGVIYHLTFLEGAPPQYLVPTAWHDGEWQFSSAPVTIPLRDEDVFACVAYSPEMKIPPENAKPPGPYRRMRTLVRPGRKNRRIVRI